MAPTYKKRFRGMGKSRFCAALLTGAMLMATPAGAASDSEWPTYGHDYGDTRFSPLAQITPANVGDAQAGLDLPHASARPQRAEALPRRKTPRWWWAAQCMSPRPMVGWWRWMPTPVWSAGPMKCQMAINQPHAVSPTGPAKSPEIVFGTRVRTSDRASCGEWRAGQRLWPGWRAGSA